MSSIKIEGSGDRWRGRYAETGSMMELDYFYPHDDPRRQAIEGIDYETVEYRTLAESIVLCLEDNPARYEGSELWDPPAGWMNEVHFSIVQQLGLKDWSAVSIVPAFKTSADIYHGIDFFVVYREPGTDREVIVTVDLSLRNKTSYKADVLVTETGARANTEYWNEAPIEVKDIDGATAVEDQMTRVMRRQSVGKMIASLINEKLLCESPHYGSVIRSVGDTINRDLDELLST